MTDKNAKITLAHGNGGKKMQELIQNIILPAFDNPILRSLNDAAFFDMPNNIAMTTDGYTVDPLFFPGGNIGKLAICGTINDLAVSCAVPKYLSCNFFIEEGFLIKDFKAIVTAMADEAKKNAVKIVTGDTKVLPKGQVNGMYIATTGIGEINKPSFSSEEIKSGDKIYVSGTLGDHGAAVLLARQEYGLSGDVLSDCASVFNLAQKLWRIPGIKFMRDPTRGGVGEVCHDLIRRTGYGVRLYESLIPIQKTVQTFCEILGFNQYFLASEGRIVVVFDQNYEHLLIELTGQITCIGIIESSHEQLVIETELGGERILPELDADPLPRIC